MAKIYQILLRVVKPLDLNQTMKDKIYNVLVDKILMGEYVEGQQLVETELSEEFNVSRSPVREAIKQLVAYDLAYSIPHKGIFVRKFDKVKMEEIFELRILIENYCIRKTNTKLSKEYVQKLKQIKTEFDNYSGSTANKEYHMIDESLHNLLVTLGNNETIIEMYNRNLTLVRSFMVSSLRDKVRFEESFDEHKMLIDSLLEGDYEKACEINERHLKTALKVIVSNL